jgi:transcription termination factor Rho
LSETDLVSTAAPRKRGLTGMVLAELRQLAGELNIPDTTGMRKGDLIAAIKERQSDGSPAAQLPLPETSAETSAEVSAAANGAAPAAAPRRRRAATRPAGAPDTKSATNGATPTSETPAPAAATPAVETPVVETQAPAVETPSPAPETAPTPAAETPAVAAEGEVGRRQRQRRRVEQNGAASEPAEAVAAATEAPTSTDAPADGAADTGRPARQSRRDRDGSQRRNGNGGGDDSRGAEPRNGDTRPDNRADNRTDTRGGEGRSDGRTDNNRADSRADNRNGDSRTENRADSRQDNRGGDTRPDNRNDNRGTNDNRANDNRGPRDNRLDEDDEDGDGRGRRGRRFRDRRRGRDRQGVPAAGGGSQGTVDTEVREGDVLLPVAGIVDILDNYAFVRTTGYLSGPTDVYVSLSMVRKYGLRRGDAITGAVREQREGEQSRQKFNPLVRVDSINGQDPENARNRPEFTKLTPLYPNERLRLETEPHKLTTRVIDLVMPIGKGQRALIVSPPKAGKTTIMQNIANAITTNNPECHLMVVLVDERPEEVTDMQRSVKGEVIASTFDRPPTDHTTIAELSIERAKRLVEMGHDVVVLLDNITRLGRAYNLAAPASGRILSGGVDSTALYPPKRFLGAARNIEDGGSLTILATALVETGSTMDTVIFEEFKGTGNAELKLDRRIADKRVFPAIDVGDSGTRKEELIMAPDEYAVMVKLRRLLSALDDQQAIDLLLTQLKKTRTNIEFLMQVAKSTPGDLD